jgi:flagellar protein FliO/FliZ
MNELGEFPWAKLIIAFAVVLGLLGGLAAILKYINAKGLTFGGRKGRERRMKIVENLAIDSKRRCVILRCDKREHLLLLSSEGDIVVETNLPPAKNPSSP